jgi:hypothetical protein
MWHFETLKDKNDPRLDEFRKAVCIENGGSEEFLLKPFTRQETFNKLHTTQLADTNPEEVFKFGLKKWSQSPLHSIEAVLLDDKIVSISASEEFNSQALRVGMLLYTLKKHRAQVRDHVFCKDGFFARHLIQAQALKKKGVFLSIYPYNKKLLAHAKNLSHSRRSFAKSQQPYLMELEDLGCQILRNVEQFIVGYRFDKVISWPTILPEFLDQ